MLKSLLIGTNGTQWSQIAVGLGLEWARELGVPVTFLGVVDVPALTHGEPLPIGAAGYKSERDARLVAEARDCIESAVREAVARATEMGVQSRTRFVDGDPPEELGREAQRHDVLVIGKRAVPHSDHDPPASKTMTDILHHSPRPVIVAGETVSPDPTVMVAYDGSRQAARALASFVASGIYADRPVHVVVVGDDQERMEAKAQRAVDFLTLHGRTADAQVMRVGNSVAETLIAASKRIPTGLLVMGVYGKPKIKEMLFGSVTRMLVARVPVPLFLDH